MRIRLDWIWPGWIWTQSGSENTLVRHQQALPVEKMFIFVLFSLLFFFFFNVKECFVYCVRG